MKSEHVGIAALTLVLMIIMMVLGFRAGYETRNNEVLHDACTASGNQWEAREDICVTPYEVVEP